MDSPIYPPLLQLSPTNRGPVLSVFTFICLTTTFIVVGVKLFSVFYFQQRRSGTSVPIWFALICAFIQSILIQYAVERGLGRHKTTLSESSLGQYQKLVYSAEIFLIAALSLSKLSTALLVQKLSPKNNIRTASWVAIGLIAVWTVFAILGNTLQCGLPNPWTCPGKRPIQYTISALNILTDVVLIGIPIFMLRNVQMSLGKRLRIEAAFAVRLFVPVATIVQMVFMEKYIDSQDYTWYIVDTAVCKQFMVNVSIITACMPTLYHVLSGFSAGLADLHIPENLELSTQNRSKHSQTNSKSDFSNSRSGRFMSPTRKSDNNFARHLHSPFGTRDDPLNYGHHTHVRVSSDDASTESTRRLTRAESQGVVKTVDVWVKVESR